MLFNNFHSAPNISITFVGRYLSTTWVRYRLRDINHLVITYNYNSSGLLYEVDISDYTHDKFKWCPRMYLDMYKQPFWKILIFNLFSTHFCGKNGKKQIKNYNGLSEGGRTVFSSPLNCSRWVDIVSAQVYQNRTKNE